MVPPESAVAARPAVTDLDALEWDNRFTRSLPADPVDTNSRRQVHGAAYSRVPPTPVADPTTLAWSPEVADLLGIDHAVCESADFASVFGGNRVPPGADPFAMCYGGHQFGNWAGQLGDGRAIALGEIVAPDGSHQTLQLKGAGPTPYSRTADGRAVLRSSLREFLCSEAMHHLGVPTTRALSLVSTGDEVWRDVLYDGHPAAEPGAVVCRVAPSFTRFGNFQLPPSRGDLDLLRALVDHTLSADFPHLTAAVAGSAAPAPGDEAIAALFDEVCDRTATLAVHWMRVGFVHGVLNTDNMSILGLTIDYGPYGWLENFDPGWTPNTTDAAGRRYRYGAQPQIVHWNLAQLGSALVPIVSDPQPLQAALDRFADRYAERFTAMINRRLGWGVAATSGGTGDVARDADTAGSGGASDADLVGDMFSVLTSSEIDQVLFFRHLAEVPVADADDRSDDDLLDPVRVAWYRPEELVADHATATAAWLRRWAARARAGGLSDTQRRAAMNATNPRYVLRNSLAQEAIDAATDGDLSLTHELLDVLRRPYDDQPGRDRFAAKRPEWARHRVGCSMLSCSS